VQEFNPASERYSALVVMRQLGKELAELIIPPDFGSDTDKGWLVIKNWRSR